MPYLAARKIHSRQSADRISCPFSSYCSLGAFSSGEEANSARQVTRTRIEHNTFFIVWFPFFIMSFPVFKIKTAIVASPGTVEDQLDTFTFNFPSQSLAWWCV